MAEGWSQSLERLAEVLARSTGGSGTLLARLAKVVAKMV
jgi:hypothetical protein